MYKVYLYDHRPDISSWPSALKACFDELVVYREYGTYEDDVFQASESEIVQRVFFVHALPRDERDWEAAGVRAASGRSADVRSIVFVRGDDIHPGAFRDCTVCLACRYLGNQFSSFRIGAAMRAILDSDPYSRAWQRYLRPCRIFPEMCVLLSWRPENGQDAARQAYAHIHEHIVRFVSALSVDESIPPQWSELVTDTRRREAIQSLVACAKRVRIY